MKDWELKAELRALWRKRKPFLMQMEVGAPYDGCFCEPNLFLVTPPGSDMQKELMGQVPSRYSPRREKALKEKHAAQSALWSAQYWFDREFTAAASVNDVLAAYGEMDAASEKWIEAEAEYELAVAADPKPMKQPQLYVWPLCASGQGRAMDCVHSIKELVQVCETESCFALATRPRYPEGLQGSRLVSDGTGCYGRITLVAVSPMGPINDVLPAGARYWMHALSVAQEQWGVTLSWRCDECDSVIEFDDYEGRPEMTGYVGDGGIGIHPEGVMCQDCLQLGACEHCRDAGADPTQYYDPKIKEHAWNLCGYCTENLLSTCGLAGEVDLPTTVTLKWWKDPKQQELPGIPAPPVLVFTDGEDKVIEGLEFDTAALIEKARSMDLEQLHPEYGHGLSLPGGTVENEAFKGTCRG